MAAFSICLIDRVGVLECHRLAPAHHAEHEAEVEEGCAHGVHLGIKPIVTVECQGCICKAAVQSTSARFVVGVLASRHQVNSSCQSMQVGHAEPYATSEALLAATAHFLLPRLLPCPTLENAISVCSLLTCFGPCDY